MPPQNTFRHPTHPRPCPSADTVLPKHTDLLGTAPWECLPCPQAGRRSHPPQSGAVLAFSRGLCPGGPAPLSYARTRGEGPFLPTHLP